MIVNYLMTFLDVLGGIFMTAGAFFGWVSFCILVYEYFHSDPDD